MNEGQLRFGSSGGGGSSVYTPPEQWAYNNLVPSLTLQTIPAQVSGDFDDVPEIRAGSVVGLSVRLTSPIIAGTASVRLSINGIPAGLTLTMNSGTNPSGGVITQAPLLDAYTAGQKLGLLITTSGTFSTGGPVDLEAYIETATPGSGGGPGPGSAFLTVDGSTRISNFVATPGFVNLLDNPGKSANATLPSAATAGVTAVIAFRLVYDTGGWTIVPDGTDTIDGQSFMFPGAIGSYLILMSDGISNWVSIATSRSLRIRQDGTDLNPPNLYRGFNVISPLTVNDLGQGMVELSAPPPAVPTSEVHLTWFPGSGLLGPAVFDNIYDLFVQGNALIAAMPDVQIVMRVDDSVTSPAVWGGGSFDMTNYELSGRGVATAITINDGTILPNLKKISNFANITVTGLGPVVLHTNQDWILRVESNASIHCTGGGPFLRSFSAVFQVGYLLIDGGRLMNGAYEVIEMLGGGSTGMQIYVRANPWEQANGTQIGVNTIRGNGGGTALAVAEPNTDVSEQQANMVNPLQLLTTAFRRGVFPNQFVAGGSVAANDGYTCIFSSSAPTNIALLTTAASSKGLITTIKSHSGSTSSLTVVPQGGDTIDGAANYPLPTANKSVTIQSDGISNWMVIAAT